MFRVFFVDATPPQPPSSRGESGVEKKIVEKEALN
jgi:hypothetical protein